MDKFINLGIKTEYSSFGEICKIDDLIDKAKEYKMSALSKIGWGKDGFYGNADFYKKCKENNIKPVIGISGALKYNDEKVFIVIYAKNTEGYDNLIKIFEKDYGYVLLEDILQNYKSLICVIKIQAGYGNEEIISKLKQTFRDDLYFGLCGEGNYYDRVKMLSRDYDIKTVIFENVCFVNKEDLELYRANKRRIEEEHNYKHIEESEYEEDLYFKSQNEIIKKYPFDLKSINTTCEIADKCNLVFNTQAKEICKCDENKLKQEIYEGIKIRGVNVTEEVKDRIEFEWNVFKKNGQLNYVNFFKGLCMFAKSNNIAIGSGRGPVCASLICYALNITDINPLNYGLIFERIPKQLDIDIDVDPGGYEKIINHLKEVYGENNVLGVITKTSNGYSQHACKWIIKSDNDIMPIEKIDEKKVAMLNTNEVEYLEVFNIDILKLSPLKNIKNTVSLIRESYGTDILFDADKCDDERTFNLINSLDTENIFELFGSEGANKLIKKYPVKNLNDLSFIIAMFRPYMDELKPSCDEEVKVLLNSYLSETHGLLLYQEQLMKILHDLFGFSYEEADGARKQIAKRKCDNKPDYKALFMERAIAKFEVKLSNKIWDYLYDNGKYCFLKAHSISYAFMSYQTAYLKANYREEFEEVFNKKDV